jgi:Ca2+-binding RTX toxin-like protein
MSGTIAPIFLSDIAFGRGGFVITGRDAGDRSGNSVASAGDINGDGFTDLIIGAPFGDGTSASRSDDRGESYVVFGKASGWGVAIDLGTIAAGTGGFVIHAQDRDDRSGSSVASAGDINGDGFADLIIGAFRGDAAGNAQSDAGESYVIFGKASGWGAAIDLATIAAGTGGFVIHGQDARDYSGYSVASAGDINGDGFADLIIGARGGDAAGNAKAGAGESYVVFGKASGWGAAIDLATIAAGTGGFVIHGQDSLDSSGGSVASAGDINGDGFDDLIIGAASGDAAGIAKANAGESYVVFGKATGWTAAIDLATIAGGTGGFVIYGRDSADTSGISVDTAGDINGDGFADLIIGADRSRGADNAKRSAGESYVVFGQGAGWGAAIDLESVAGGTGGFVIYGRDESDYSGGSVASAGDVNGDGFDDLIIGALLGDGTSTRQDWDSGESYVVFGKASGWSAINLSDIAAGRGGFVINGRFPGDRSGVSVASAGDVNGDGFADLIIGAEGGDWTSGSSTDNRGESYVIFGRDFTNTVTHAGTASAEVLTGTNAANVMVGGLGNDTLDGLGGADALKGGAGDDRIQVADLAFLNIDGGTGTDTLALTGSGLTLNLASIADTKLQGIEEIDLGAGGNTLRLTALEVRNLSETSNTLRVTGATGASVSFDDTGWVQGATSDGFVTFTNGTATAIVAQALLAPPPSGPTNGNDNLAGTTGNDSIDGLAGNDSILGAAGNDTLTGGAGADTLGGGAGDDLFFVSDAADVVIELAGGGADTIIASVNMTMPDQVEVLQIASGISGITLTGGAGNDMLVGNGLANTFNGGAGDDVILAGNGTLADIYALFAT